MQSTTPLSAVGKRAPAVRECEQLVRFLGPQFPRAWDGLDASMFRGNGESAFFTVIAVSASGNSCKAHVAEESF
jgi:hypothetical protein